MAEGRHPWQPGCLQLPEVELRDLDSGVWALASGSHVHLTSGGLASPHLIVTGSDEGLVQVWDVRCGSGGAGVKELWKQQVVGGADYVGGLVLDPLAGR